MPSSTEVARYRLYGLVAASDVPLPELPDAAGSAQLTIHTSAIVDPADARWFDIWPHSDGTSWVRATRTSAGYVIRHGEHAAFDLDAARRTIAYDAAGCPAPLFRHYLIDQIVPLMLSLDSIVLHASGVAVGGGISAFVGPSGAGKSTLALALARQGRPMAADDGLLLRLDGTAAIAVPSYPWVRVWDDSAVALNAADLPPFISEAAPLTDVYVLDPAPSTSVSFRRLSRADAVMALTAQAYRLALDDRAALARQFDDIVALSGRVSVWRLSYPRALPLAREIAAGIDAHAAAVQAPN